MAEGARDVLATTWLMHHAEFPLEHAQVFIAEHRDAEHFGDCTKQASTCCRCLVDEAHEFADAQLAALDAAGLAVVPPRENKDD